MEKTHHRSCAWGILLPVVLLIIGITFLVRRVDLPRANILPSELTPLPLAGIRKILILAPHCDDETLAAGGLIQAAVQSGIEVRVIIATNGDGYRFATIEEFRKLYPTAKDYIHMGEVRQNESLSALAKLGVSPDNIYFLSYPDRGTANLLEQNWSSSTPYTSRYSGMSKSPYPRTYHPVSVYAGEDYLGDVESIIKDFHPDLVVFPNGEDVHPDHWGLGAFTRLALAEVSHGEPGYQPKQLTYLVHRPDYPVVWGLKRTAGLVPPPALTPIYTTWLGWALSAAQIQLKEKAIQEYKSQLPLLRGLMDSFIRSNELFAPVLSSELQESTSGKLLDPSSWKNALGETIAPTQPDPTGDVISHKVAPETDLKAVYVTRTPYGALWLCAQLHGKAEKEIAYTIRLKSLTASGIRSFEARTRSRRDQARIIRSGNYFCASTTLAKLGDPWGIFVDATVESPDPLLPLDQTAWQMVYLTK
jgi:LmbE family N-acetylglucosaminyl deacetylase